MRVRRGAGAAATAALVLVLAACSGGDAANDPDPSPAAASSRTGKPQPAKETKPAVPVADPAHAVDPPGKRDGRLWSADILVQWDKEIDADLVKKIEKLEGVAHTERIGLGQVSLENRVLTVASVNPARYRNFTQADVADFQEAWDRVAGGEMAIDKLVAKRLADKAGMIRLGSEDSAPTLHVGAYTPQIPTIDMVVNTAWAGDIGMATDNGLLISTDDITPATIRKPLEKLVGKDASVQMLDIASRIGLDPGATLTAIPTGGSIGSVVGTYRYRVIGGGRIAPESSWVAANIRTEPVPILGSVTCHKDLFPQLRAALLEVQQAGLAAEIHPGEYAGCYYPRFIANTTTLSNHSFGLALDLNVPGNGRGTVGEMNRAVVAIFKKWGFAWGGDWRYTDPMHFELREIKRAG
jgi:D-alanyl-D-alanine carboxypeptidase